MITRQKLLTLKQLLQKKYREESNSFLLEGWKSIDEAVNAGIAIDTIVYVEMKVEHERLLAKFEKSTKQMLEARSRDLETLSDTVTSQGIIAVLPKFDAVKNLAAVSKNASLIIALDSINDPGNLGTIIRTCDWFNVDAVIIGKNSVDLYNPKVVRATMGSLFHLPIVPEVDLPEFLLQEKKNGFTVYSTELIDSEDIRSVSVGPKSIIVIGSESHGVSHEISVRADTRLSIPRFGKAESLNAAIASGIILSQIKLRTT